MHVHKDIVTGGTHLRAKVRELCGLVVGEEIHDARVAHNARVAGQHAIYILPYNNFTQAQSRAHEGGSQVAAAAADRRDSTCSQPDSVCLLYMLRCLLTACADARTETCCIGSRIKHLYQHRFVRRCSARTCLFPAPHEASHHRHGARVFYRMSSQCGLHRRHGEAVVDLGVCKFVAGDEAQRPRVKLRRRDAEAAQEARKDARGEALAERHQRVFGSRRHLLHAQ